MSEEERPVEHCQRCGEEVAMMAQRNTGYCCARCEEAGKSSL